MDPYKQRRIRPNFFSQLRIPLNELSVSRMKLFKNQKRIFGHPTAKYGENIEALAAGLVLEKFC